MDCGDCLATYSLQQQNSLTETMCSQSLKYLLLGPSAAAAAAKSLWLCPTLCDPVDSSPPGFPVPGVGGKHGLS